MAPTSKTDEYFGGLQALEPKRNNLLWEVFGKREDTPLLRLYWLLSDSSPLGTHSIGAGFQSMVQRIFRTRWIEVRSYMLKNICSIYKCLFEFLTVQILFHAPVHRSCQFIVYGVIYIYIYIYIFIDIYYSTLPIAAGFD